MITVKKLKELLKYLPGTARIHAYEGESTGLSIETEDGRYFWITAYDSEKEDDQTEFLVKVGKVYDNQS